MYFHVFSSSNQLYNKLKHVSARVSVSVIGVIAKRPVLPLCAVDGHSRNPLYCCYY